MSRTYNELGLVYSNAGYDYSGRTTASVNASGSGSGDSSVTTLVSKSAVADGSGQGTSGSSAYVTRIVSASGTGAGTAGSNASVTPAVRRDGTGSGLGSSSAVTVRTVIRDNQEGNGFGTQTAVGIRTAVALSSGVGQSNQSASVLRTSVTSGIGSGLGDATNIVVTRVFYRSSVSAGISANIAIRRMTSLRPSVGVGAGSTGVAIWRNAGQTLNDKLLIPPTWIPNARPKYRRN